MSGKEVSDLHQILLIISIVNQLRPIHITSMQTFNHLSSRVSKLLWPFERLSQIRVWDPFLSSWSPWVISVLPLLKVRKLLVPWVHQEAWSLTILILHAVCDLVLMIPTDTSREITIICQLPLFEFLKFLVKECHFVAYSVDCSELVDSVSDLFDFASIRTSVVRSEG